MPLTAGTKLGPYEIHSLLGAGGSNSYIYGLDQVLSEAFVAKGLK